MKRFGIYTFLCFFLCGCYEEDIVLPLPNDEGFIVGEWEGSFVEYQAEDGSDIFWDTFYCENSIMMICFEDGRLWYVDFVRDPNADDACIEDAFTEQIGTWKRKGIGKYEFHLQNGYDGSEVLIKPERIEFSAPEQETKTMRIFYKESPKKGPPDAVSYYRTLFKR